MTHAVNVKAMDTWMRENEPMAIEKLATTSRVSTKTLKKVIDGKAPGHAATRWCVSQAIGIAEDVLFPVKKQKNA